jgi:hypothetical protein
VQEYIVALCSVFMQYTMLKVDYLIFKNIFHFIKISLIMLKGVYLLIMGTFNMFLVLNQFCMDKIKYC